MPNETALGAGWRYDEARWWEENGWRFDLPTGTYRNDELTRLALAHIPANRPERWPGETGALAEYGASWTARDFTITRAVSVGQWLRAGSQFTWAVRPALRGCSATCEGGPRTFAWYGICRGRLPAVEPLEEREHTLGAVA